MAATEIGCRGLELAKFLSAMSQISSKLSLLKVYEEIA